MTRYREREASVQTKKTQGGHNREVPFGQTFYHFGIIHCGEEPGKCKEKTQVDGICLDNLLCAHQREVNVVLMAQISEESCGSGWPRRIPTMRSSA